MGLFDRFRAKVLYFPGCPAKFLVKDVQRRHEQLLTMFGIEYVKLPELEVCCGKPALDFGFLDDFKSLRLKNKNTFANQKITKIITSDPKCYSTFKKKYEDIEVEHISTTILNNIDKIERRFDDVEVSFYDACNPYKMKELYDKPREILEALGFSVKELSFCKESSLCCGKALEAVSPKVAAKMAEEVVKDVPSDTVVTMSPDCYIQLKKVNSKVKVLELSEVLL